MKKIHFVNWFPDWKGIMFNRTNPRTDINSGYFLIYKWFIVLGFFEIRKLMNAKERKMALKIYRQRQLTKQNKGIK